MHETYSIPYVAVFFGRPVSWKKVTDHEEERKKDREERNNAEFDGHTLSVHALYTEQQSLIYRRLFDFRH